MLRVLLSCVGNRDPYDEHDQTGPVLALLGERAFDHVYLFYNADDYLVRGREVERAAAEDEIASAFHFAALEIDSPIDYESIYAAMRARVAAILADLEGRQAAVSILLDPGTPQMQTAWFLLAKAGVVDVRLLQGIPARFAGGAYKVKEVDLDAASLPRVVEATLAPPPSIADGSLSSSDAGDAGVAEQTEGESVVLRNWYGDGARLRVIGRSPAFLGALEHADRFARYDLSVLITGATGTGKEVVARLIHEQSSRAAEVFVALNCAAIGAGLAESELFGHRKGSFTGADRDRAGHFRAADRGTLFLDEVGDLSLDIQAKLLRALETGRVVPVGSDREISVDVRIIAATHRDLETMISDGTFRRDLFERFAQARIELPSLVERNDDLHLLMRMFLDEWNERYGETRQLAPDTIAALARYHWPGNVRELQNAILSMCAASRSNEVPPEVLPPQIRRAFNDSSRHDGVQLRLPDGGIDLKALLFQTERDFFQQALDRSAGNRAEAARLLGLQPPAFRKALRERFGIDGDEVASEGDDRAP